jgi:GNAT superfamily N-acetyltransferase
VGCYACILAQKIEARKPKEIDVNLTIRTARADDLDALLGLYRQLHSSDEPLPDQQEVQRVWQSILALPHHSCYFAEREGQLLATCVMTLVPNLTRGARPYALIENVVTDSAFRKQGIATRLLQHVLQLAWDQNCYKVLLLTGNPKNVPFYESAGFQAGSKHGLVAYPPSERKS